MGQHDAEIEHVAGIEVGDVSAGPGNFVEGEGVIAAAAARRVCGAPEQEGVRAGPADQMVAAVVGGERIAGVVAGHCLARTRQGDARHTRRGRIGGSGGEDRAR